MKSRSFGKEVDRLFSEAGRGEYMSPTVCTNRNTYGDDIATFAAEFHTDGLFEYLPGRHHKAYSNFTYMQGIWDPQKLAHRMMRLTEDRDDCLDLRDTEE